MKSYICNFRSTAFFLLVFLTGCCCPNHYTPFDAPPPLPHCCVPKKPQVVLVLGGGGAKGLAHIGVLEEFQNAGISFDMVVGCSAGSLVGALYCDNPDVGRLKAILEPMKTSTLIDINIWKARYGLCQGYSMRRVLHRELSCEKFEDLKIPLLIVATDLYSGELVCFGGGAIVPAVQASCSIPFFFAPVEHQGRIFVDGGVIDPCPARIGRELGADLVIAVDLGGLLPKTFPTNLFGVTKRSAEITLLWQSESCLEKADIVIRPDLHDIGTFDDGQNLTIYELGKKAARDMIPEIKKRLAQLPPKQEVHSDIIAMEMPPMPARNAATINDEG